MSRELIDRAAHLFDDEDDVDGAEALVAQIPAPPPDSDEAADLQELQGLIAEYREDLPRALALLEASLATRIRVHGRTSEQAALGHSALVYYHCRHPQVVAALDSARRAVAASDGGVRWLVLLGDTQRTGGDAVGAEQSYRKALAKARGRDRLGALRGIGSVHLLQGNGRAAHKRFTEALALVDEVESVEGARLVTALGTATMMLRDAPAAIAHIERGLAIQRRVSGELHEEVCTALNELGVAWHEEDPWNAAAAFQYAVAIGDHLYADGDPEHATSLSNLADLCAELDKPELALVYAERALAIREKLLGPWHLDVALSIANIASYHRACGRTERALALADQVAAIAPQLVETRQEVAATICFVTATIVLELGKDLDRALELYQRALDLRIALREEDDEALRYTARNAAARLFEAGHADRAAAWLTAAKPRLAAFRADLGKQLAAVRAGNRDAVVDDTELAPADDDDD